jgi:hypothetical protein
MRPRSLRCALHLRSDVAVRTSWSPICAGLPLHLTCARGSHSGAAARAALHSDSQPFARFACAQSDSTLTVELARGRRRRKPTLLCAPDGRRLEDEAVLVNARAELIDEMDRRHRHSSMRSLSPNAPDARWICSPMRSMRSRTGDHGCFEVADRGRRQEQRLFEMRFLLRREMCRSVRRDEDLPPSARRTISFMAPPPRTGLHFGDPEVLRESNSGNRSDRQTARGRRHRQGIEARDRPCEPRGTVLERSDHRRFDLTTSSSPDTLADVRRSLIACLRTWRDGREVRMMWQTGWILGRRN